VRQRIIAGIDEAGLGPLLGPLALGVAALAVPETAGDPWEMLARAVTREPREFRAAAGGCRLAVADSKLVFQRSPRGARRLEETALSFLAQPRAAGGTVPRDARWLLDGPQAPAARWLAGSAWSDELPRELPLWSERESVELRAHLLAGALRRAGIEVLAAGVRLVPERELNGLCAEHGSKGLATWHVLAALLRGLWHDHGERGVTVDVDRQGARARYGLLLLRTLPEAEIARASEEPGRSSYVLAGGGRSLCVTFAEKADRDSFCVALASCLAKYARELAMHAFNRRFGALAREHGLALRPTAGYVSDGRRWLAEANGLLVRLAVDRSALVRER
jgi:hypothetical protein